MVGQFVVSENTLVPTHPLVSAASTVKLAVVDTVGVPVNTPAVLSDMPVGKTGTLSIAVEDSSGGGRFGGGGARRQGLGIGLGFGDSTVSRGGDRCDADFRPRRGPPRGYGQATQFCGAEARDRAPMGAPD